nr:transposase [Sphingomonas sp. Leaf34]
MRGFARWRWHLDETYVKLNGEMVYLWRAVDHASEAGSRGNGRERPTVGPGCRIVERACKGQIAS